MANKYGRLGTALPEELSYTSLYQVPSGSVATITVTACNKSTASADIQMALSLNGSTTPAASDFIEYNHELLGGDVIERTGIVMGDEEILYVYTTTTGSCFVANGIQEDI